MSPTTTDHVIISDVHAPYQNDAALGSLCRYLKAERPATLTIAGDYVDMKSVARWSRDLPEETDPANDLDIEIAAARDVSERLRAAYDGPIYWVRGNHEVRIENYARKYAKALLPLMREGSVYDVLSIPSLLAFKKYSIVSKGTIFELVPGWDVTHGIKALKNAGTSALATMKLTGRNLIQGHSHRLGLVPERTDVVRWGMETGHLSNIHDAAYLELPGVANWQTGFGVLHCAHRVVHPEIVAIDDESGWFLTAGHLWLP